MFFSRLPYLLFAIFFVLTVSSGFAQTKTVSTQNAATKELYALFDTEWQRNLENFPTFASYLGDKRYNNRWNDVSLEAIKKRNDRNVQALAQLGKIDRAELSVTDQLNYDLFKKDFENSIEQNSFQLYLAPIIQTGGIQTADDLANFISFETVKDFEDWIARLNAFPRFMEQTIALMREGKAK